MKIVDLKTRQLVNDYTDIESKISNGEYAFEKGKEVDVISPEGEKGRIPSSSARDAFARGFKFYSPQMQKEDDLKKEYGDGLGNELTAGALGAARGLSFGLSDQALTKLNIIKPEALKLYRDLNPDSSLIGEVAGTVGPALLTGGTSVGASIASKTLPSLVMKAGLKTASSVGGKVASKTASKIIQNTVKNAAGSAVEGALYGAGQLISEDALGDAEFNAENLMSHMAQGALIGGATGGTLSLTGGVLKKGATKTKKFLDKSLLKQLGLSDAQATSVIQKEASDELLENITREAKKKNYAEIQKAADELGVKPTQGMMSGNNIIQELESSLSQAPTLAGQAVKKEVDAVYDVLEQTTKGVFNNGDSAILNKTNLSKFEAGESIKANLIADIGEKVNKAAQFYKYLDDEFGETIVSGRVKKLLKTRLDKSDANKLFKSSEVQKIQGMIDAVETINDAKKVRTYLGKELSAAHRAGDYNRVEILDDAYKTLTRLREKAIMENSGNAKEIITGLNEANKVYASVFNDFKDVSGALKLGRIRNVNQLVDALDGMESEKIAERFFSKKNFANNSSLKTLFPESFETARKVKLAEIWEKSQHKGDISVRKFVSNLKKLSKEETDMIFGAEKKQTLEALETLVDSMPDRVGPSGTAQAMDLFNFFHVATQARDGVRYALYKRGEAGVKKYLNETLDVLKQVEKSKNNGLKQISNSVESFFEKAKQTPTIAMLNAGESRNYDAAIKLLTKFEEDPDNTLEEITENNKELFDNAPKTSEALSTKMMNIFQFLKEKAPVSYENVGYFNNYAPSRSAKSKFMRYYNYATNPNIVLKEFENGYVSPEGVETLRSIYPKTYETLYSEITSRVGEMENFTYKQKKKLYNMLSIIGASSLIPSNLRMLQSGQQQAQETVMNEQQNINKLRVTGLRNISQADRFKSKLDKIT